MRSSNLKHCKRKNLFSGSLLIAIVVAISIVAIPVGCFIPNANAVTEKEFRTLDVAINELKIKNDKETAEKALKEKLITNNEKKKTVTKATKKSDNANVITEKSVNSDANEEKASTVAKVKKVSATVSTVGTKPVTASEKKDKNSNYSPEYVSLSEYDRAKLERLVEGEAGGLGYDGCLLVAQAIRDSMNLSGTNSIDKIISDYSYSGSTHKKPSKAAKEAVSYIFDSNGYAVNHRVLYFYATDMVYSKWHETQNYITTCGNMRFFDKAI